MSSDKLLFNSLINNLDIVKELKRENKKLHKKVDKLKTKHKALKKYIYYEQYLSNKHNPDVIDLTHDDNLVKVKKEVVDLTHDNIYIHEEDNNNNKRRFSFKKENTDLKITIPSEIEEIMKPCTPIKKSDSYSDEINQFTKENIKPPYYDVTYTKDKNNNWVKKEEEEKDEVKKNVKLPYRHPHKKLLLEAWMQSPEWNEEGYEMDEEEKEELQRKFDLLQEYKQLSYVAKQDKNNEEEEDEEVEYVEVEEEEEEQEE